MQLKDMPIGSKGRIKGMKNTLPEYRRRLVMLGATPGTTFEVIRVAPLGDPIELRVRGSSISVRRDEAEILEIEPIQ
ncbi:MAG TPA: ferrous iron transport protein A [Candidatus Aphodousia gallistercoris]|nr:ferrous iron transport protein A [Candidatus Aphodousia gallistercoris]